MDKIISSFFTNNGAPQLGLTPTIRIWEVSSSSNTLVVTDEAMTEVGNGFYKYVFTNYNPTHDYLIRTDGGNVLNNSDRYQKGSNNNSLKEVWAAETSDNNEAGTFGAQNNEQLSKINTALSVLEILLKFDVNRTKVDQNNKTLTVYDDDGITPLYVFDLKDFSDNPSVDTIAERVPQ